MLKFSEIFEICEIYSLVILASFLALQNATSHHSKISHDNLLIISMPKNIKLELC